MHVASKQLCEELYRLSRWDSDDLLHYLENRIEYRELHQSDLGGQTKKQAGYCPAYSLGYLLRKLPERVHIHKRSDIHYSADYMLNTCFADTPEDALCKLAIELINQGILPGKDK